MPALPAPAASAEPKNEPLEVVTAREAGPDFEREWT